MWQNPFWNLKWKKYKAQKFWCRFFVKNARMIPYQWYTVWLIRDIEAMPIWRFISDARLFFCQCHLSDLWTIGYGFFLSVTFWCYAPYTIMKIHKKIIPKTSHSSLQQYTILKRKSGNQVASKLTKIAGPILIQANQLILF